MDQRVCCDRSEGVLRWIRGRVIMDQRVCYNGSEGVL